MSKPIKRSSMLPEDEAHALISPVKLDGRGVAVVKILVGLYSQPPRLFNAGGFDRPSRSQRQATVGMEVSAGCHHLHISR